MAVTPEDIAVELGRPTPLDPATAAQWQSWVDRTLRQIGRRLGDVALLDQGTLDDVVLLAVAAHARNPEGVDTYDISVDDGRESRRYRHSDGEITIKDLWWSWLSPASASGAFSTRTFGEADTYADRAPYPVQPWPSGI